MNRLDAHQRQRADRLAARGIDDGVVQRIGGRRGFGQIVAKCVEVRERSDEEIRPVAAIRRLSIGVEEIRRVALHVERLDAAMPAVDADARGPLARRPLRHRFADGLPILVGSRHA